MVTRVSRTTLACSNIKSGSHVPCHRGQTQCYVNPGVQTWQLRNGLNVLFTVSYESKFDIATRNIEVVLNVVE